jgi:hypothetical protein
MPKQRAVYYRDEAGKCLWHADNVMNAEIRAELLKLADEYIERAAAAEREEAAKNRG